MEYRHLGRSGLRVSELSLGSWVTFDTQVKVDAAMEMMTAAYDAGINFFDNAEAYAKGESEKVMGAALKKLGWRRSSYLVSTKFYWGLTDGVNQKNTLNRKYLMEAIDGSLKRLGLDHVDLVFCHRPDAATPIEETVGALGDAIRAGKIRYWGLSNFASWRAAQACETADRMGVPRPIASQPYYNAMNRMPEVEHLPACAAYGLGIVPYSPVARGVLTGKYPVDGPPPKGTRTGHADKRMMESEYRRESLEIAQIVRDHAERRGMTAAQFATLWVLNNRLITAVIAGPRTMAQWTEYLGALNHEFTAEDEALIDSLVPPGHPSTPGYTDPNHPVIGRPVHSR